MNDALLLPWSVQTALAAGVLGYFVAYRGIRAHHNTVETAFLSLAFGMIARLTQYALRDHDPTVSVGVAFGVTLIAGALWRLIGINLAASVARGLDLSWADDSPSAWAKLQTNSRAPISQIAVLLDNGTWLSCDDTRPFADLPNGPFTLGTDGDIALYPTHMRPEGGDRKEVNATLNSAGARITYVPATQVKRVTLRFADRPITRLRRLAAAARQVCSRWSRRVPWA